MAKRQAEFNYAGGPAASWGIAREGLGRPMPFEYEPIYLERYEKVERQVADVFGTKGDGVRMMGEAVLGLEAATKGLVQPRMKCLNLVSGIFGKWFGDWLRALEAEVIAIEVPWNEAIDAAAVERALKADPDIKIVSLVHSETPSGTLNPMAQIGPIARAAGALVITDAVSAFAGTPIKQDEWGLDITVGGTHKCLGGSPGLALVAVSDRAWAAMADNPSAPRGSYLSLLDWKSTWLDGRKQFPYITSVAEINGLEAALDRLFDEGLEASYASHRMAADASRAGVRAMGLKLWVPDDSIASHAATCITTPDGISNAEVIDHVHSNYGVQISDGEHANMKAAVFRIGHMGPAATSLHPVVALSALGKGLRDFGVDVTIGAGVEAALEVLGRGAADPRIAVPA
jgi:pyridoxamine--pyruvate transaminase